MIDNIYGIIIFKTDKGLYLNTKTEHLNYLMIKNIVIKQY